MLWSVTPPLLHDLTNGTNVAHYSPSSARPDSTFLNFSAQQSPQHRGETLKSDYYSQVTLDLGLKLLSTGDQ